MYISRAAFWALATALATPPQLVSAVQTNIKGHVDLNFQQYKAGDVLSDLGHGVHLRAIKKDKQTKQWVPGQPMIFDSAFPTGQDDDLGTPNEKYGGPGIGVAGQTGPVANTMALGNLIIVSEDEDHYDPDDNVGGILVFTFDEPMFLDSCVMVDNEEDTEFDVEYTAGGTRKIFLGEGGDNSVETVTFHDKTGFDQPISALNITMHGSGAISFVAVRPAAQTQKTLDDNTCQSDFVFDASSPFTYKDDIFRGTSSPNHAEGTTKTVGGTDLLEVRLGSIDGTGGKRYGMSGGFETTFTLMEPSDVQITVKAQLSLVTYEVDEYAEALVSVDGILVGRGSHDNVLRIDGVIAGNGGLESLTLDTVHLEAGEHTLVIGGFNNKKTGRKEVTTIHYESVDIEAIYDCALPTANPTASPTSSSPTSSPTVHPTTASPTIAPTKEGDPRKGQKGTLPPSAAPTGNTLAVDLAPGQQTNATVSPTSNSTVSPTATPTGQNKGHGGGDPHFKTWTGVKFDYHGECDLVLVHNPGFANGIGLHVQIRTTRVKYYSYIERIAVNIGSDVLEFGNDIDDWLLNGRAPPSDRATLGGFEVRKFTRARALSIRLNDQTKSKIDLFRRKTGMPYIMIDGGHDTSMFEGSSGMIGDFTTGKMMGRDGVTEFTDGEQFALEWQVRTNYEPMMFQTARAPQFPQLCLPPQKILGGRLGDSHMKKKAEAICEAWKEDMEDCIFDVMATRDLSGATEAPVHHTATH